MPENPGPLPLKAAALALAGLGAAAALYVLPLRDGLRAASEWAASLGAWGPAAIILLYVPVCVLLLPAAPLTLAAGAAFGVARGGAAVLAGATLGACCAFLLGRYGARGWVERRVAGSPRFQAIDDAVAREGWKIVLLTRLSPAFPFNLQNYAYGLTRVRFRDYAWASLVGMAPGTFLFVYLGAFAGELAGASGRSRTPAEWVVFALGLAATLGAAVYAARVARRALEEPGRRNPPPS